MSGAIWLTADLFVIVSAAALARAVASESTPWLLVSLFVGVLGVLTSSTAILMLIVLVIVCAAKLLRPKLLGPGSRPLLLGTAALAVLVLALGVAYRNAPQAKPDFAFDLPSLVEFVLIYLGNALTPGRSGSWPASSSSPPVRLRFGVLPPSVASRKRSSGSFSSSSRPSTRS
jgi:hypothetical protein